MLTVRQIELSGHETIIQASHVWSSSIKTPRGKERIVYAAVEGQMEPLRFGSGTIFVMDVGHTVAKYELDIAGHPASAPR